MRQFVIPETALCSYSVYKNQSIFEGLTELTPEQLVIVLKGEDMRSSIQHNDLPEFAELRNLPESERYIEAVRGSWNCDTVLKPFVLNGEKFNEHEQFPNGGNMLWRLRLRTNQ